MYYTPAELGRQGKFPITAEAKPPRGLGSELARRGGLVEGSEISKSPPNQSQNSSNSASQPADPYRGPSTASRSEARIPDATWTIYQSESRPFSLAHGSALSTIQPDGPGEETAS
jgi:hypothetical protein